MIAGQATRPEVYSSTVSQSVHVKWEYQSLSVEQLQLVSFSLIVAVRQFQSFSVCQPMSLNQFHSNQLGHMNRVSQPVLLRKFQSVSFCQSRSVTQLQLHSVSHLKLVSQCLSFSHSYLMVTHLQSRNVFHSVLDNQCLSVMSQSEMGRKVVRITEAELICFIEKSAASIKFTKSCSRQL